MPLGEIVGHVVVEVVLEIVIKGPGFLICRVFKPDIDPDSHWSVVAGLVFWAALCGLGYVIYLGFAR